MSKIEIPPMSPASAAAVADVVELTIQREYATGDAKREVSERLAAAHDAAVAQLVRDLIAHDGRVTERDARGVATSTLPILVRDGLVERVCQCRRLHPRGCPHGAAIGQLWCDHHYEADVPALEGARLCGTCYVGEETEA